MNENEVHELVLADEGLQHLLVQVAVVADESADLLLGKSSLAIEKTGNLVWIGAVQKSGFVQELQPLLGIEVELLDAEEKFFVGQTFSAVMRGRQVAGIDRVVTLLKVRKDGSCYFQ